MNDEMSAVELGEAISAAQRDIVLTLNMLAQRLPENFMLTACNVDVNTDRTYGGDVHYRIGATISVQLKEQHA